MNKINNIKDKMNLHPIMTFIILIGITIFFSGFFALINYQANYSIVSSKTGDFKSILVGVDSLFSLSGLKYIFSNTVSNYANFIPLVYLIIILIGIGVMEKSGFLKTAFTLLTQKSRKNIITFVTVFISLLASIAGDIGYIVLIPLIALLYKYGKRNPILGIITVFGALTCGSGLNILLSSIDTLLVSNTLLSAYVLDTSYTIGNYFQLFIMLITIIIMSFVLTFVSEKIVAPRIGKYDKNEEDEVVITKKDLKGLIFGLGAGVIYLLFFVYNIIPGLPLSGALLDNTQNHYIDKLFGFDSFFSNGFVFIITILFIIMGFFYGLGAKTIKNNKEFSECFGHSLDGVGNIIVLIFFASLFISIFKKTGIGTVVTATFANFLSTTSLSGLPLIIIFFIIVAISGLFLTSSIARWTVLSGTVVPLMMNSGITPEFSQVIFNFADCTTKALTPLLAYFVVYLAFIEKYNQKPKPIGLFKSIKYMIPYSVATFIVLLTIIICWYVIGIPIGIGATAVL